MATNPYHPPADVDELSVEVPVARESEVNANSRYLSYAWPIVFLLNLIVPILLASSLLKITAVFGLIVVVVAYLAVGWLIGRRWPGLLRRVVAGGWVICVSQVLPMIQMLAGLIAIELVGWLGVTNSVDDLMSPKGLNSGVTVALVTFFCGGILLTAALFVGVGIIGVKDFFWRAPPVATEAL